MKTRFIGCRSRSWCLLFGPGLIGHSNFHTDYAFGDIANRMSDKSQPVVDCVWYIIYKWKQLNESFILVTSPVTHWNFRSNAFTCVLYIIRSQPRAATYRTFYLPCCRLKAVWTLIYFNTSVERKFHSVTRDVTRMKLSFKCFTCVLYIIRSQPRAATYRTFYLSYRQNLSLYEQ